MVLSEVGTCFLMTQIMNDLLFPGGRKRTMDNTFEASKRRLNITCDLKSGRPDLRTKICLTVVVVVCIML